MLPHSRARTEIPSTLLLPEGPVQPHKMLDQGHVSSQNASYSQNIRGIPHTPSGVLISCGLV
jgi:hypothetical protein